MKRPQKAVLALLAGTLAGLVVSGCAIPTGSPDAGSVVNVDDAASVVSQHAETRGIPAFSDPAPPPPEATLAAAGSTATTIPWPSETAVYEPVRMAAYQSPGETPWPGGIAQSFPSTELPSEPPLYTPWQSSVAAAAAPEPTVTYQPAMAPPSPVGRLGAYWEETKLHVVGDYRNYYRWQTGLELGIAVGLAAPLANTSLDHDFRDWYQDDIRSSGSDDLSSFWKPWGEGKIFVPAWAGLAVVGKMLDDRPVFSLVGEFSDRTTRAYLVGAPPMLLMQYVLGASRPGETPDTSHWKPFDDTNAVSGHAFIGAVPFITAANMVEDPWAKGTFYALSTFTAWSRVNDDRHYLSQVCLGWYMAYLAARAVDQTEHADQLFRVVPIASPQMTGLGVVVRH